MGKRLTAPIGLRTLLRAMAVWACTALVLLLAASAVLSFAGTGSAVLGYISSAVSFLCAVFAGAAAGGGAKGKSLINAILTAGLLILILLTLGFIIRGSDLDSSSILSVVSFSLAGCVLGSLLPGGGHRKKRGKGSFRFSTSGKG